MKRIIASLVVGVLALASLFAADLTIVHTSDFHYYSQYYIQDPDYMRRVMLTADGKDTIDSVQIAQTFVKDMLELRPDAVVVTGDLTLNGETKSHQELYDLLHQLKENGIGVYVMTGNHDVGQTAYKYVDGGLKKVESLGAMEFETLWWDLGFGTGIYQDDWSDSYISQLADDLWILSIDSNTGSKGTIRTKTLSWIEEHLKEAQEKGIKVISLTHQNLFVHSKNFTWGYQLDNASKLLALYQKYGVTLNLSGHLHIQHIVEQDGITDIAASSMADYPLQYGVLTIHGDDMSYETRQISDETLIQNAKEVFDACTENKSVQRLSEVKDEQAKARMLELSLQLNREYFAGHYSDIDEEALQMWANINGEGFASYLSYIYDKDADHRIWSNH